MFATLLAVAMTGQIISQAQPNQGDLVAVIDGGARTTVHLGMVHAIVRGLRVPVRQDRPQWDPRQVCGQSPDSDPRTAVHCLTPQPSGDAGLQRGGQDHPPLDGSPDGAQRRLLLHRAP